MVKCQAMPRYRVAISGLHEPCRPLSAISALVSMGAKLDARDLKVVLSAKPHELFWLLKTAVLTGPLQGVLALNHIGNYLCGVCVIVWLFDVPTILKVSIKKFIVIGLYNYYLVRSIRKLIQSLNK